MDLQKEINADSNGAGVKLMSNGKLKNSLVQNNTHTNTYSSWGSDTKSIGGGGISMSAGSIVDGCIIKANKANKENNDRYTCGAGIHMNGARSLILLLWIMLRQA